MGKFCGGIMSNLSNPEIINNTITQNAALNYNNILPWIPMLKGNQIADIPIVAASTDPCMSCTNRVAIIDNGKKYQLDKQKLYELSVEKTRRLMK